MQNVIYKLRAHHCLCACFFKGKGYSAEFTAHMAQTLEKLQAGGVVCLADGVDVLCEKCPNNQAGVCKTAQLVAEYDEKVLSYCGLKIGDVLPFTHLKNLALERIICAGHREEICGNCQWSDICHLEKEEK